MSPYDITFARSALKELESYDNELLNRIFSRIESLSEQPRPHGCIKLKGNNDLWRIRIGNYRVLYSIDDNQNIVDIISIGHRKDIY